MTRRWLLALALLTGACSGGGDDGDNEASASGSASSTEEEREETTTTDEPEGEAVELPTSFRVEGSIDYGGATADAAGIVAEPTRYDLSLSDVGFASRTIRIGDRVFNRSGSDPAAVDTQLYIEGAEEDSTALGFLVSDAQFGPLPDEPGFEVTGAEVAIDALAELLFTDPRGLLAGAEDAPADGAVVDVEVPDDIADALDAMDLEPPGLDASFEVGDDDLRIELRVSGEDVDFGVEASYTDLDAVTEDDVPSPDGSLIDPTPWLEEEELATFTDATLVAPAPPPEGFVLSGAIVLDEFETTEGCREVELDYVEADDPVDGHLVQLFVFDKTCGNQFDPTPFDETTGGVPSRYDGAELLVGATIVQVLPTQSRFDLEAFAATLAPTTAEALVASVVPPPD